MYIRNVRCRHQSCKNIWYAIIDTRGDTVSLPQPKGDQIKVLCLPEVGHYVVLGTAGSGKTTLAIQRAAYLAKRTKTDHRVLLVTFNKSLVTYLNAISEGSLSKVDVHHYHKFAKGYLSNAGILGKYGDIVNNDYRKFELIKKAIDEVIEEKGKNSTLSRAPEVFKEEVSWMQKMGITTLHEYINAERIGRAGTRINKDKRKYFFYVYEKYLEIRGRYEYRYDWDDIAYAVKERLENDKSERMYKHIIIDEGQDLSPVMLRSLTLAIPEDGSITFFGDVAQQIYGGRISWRNAGLNVKTNEIWKFDQNYRNSKEIAKLAIAISKLPCFDKNVDLVTPKHPVASGPKPVLIQFDHETKEINWVVDNAPKLAKTQTVGILVRTRDIVRKIISKLNYRDISCQELHGNMSRWESSPGISVGTYHSAKGLEFDTVLIPYCSKSRIPDQERLKALEDDKEVLSEESKLIYVAVTRARRGLILTYTGEITEVVPIDDSLYNKHIMI